jgi:chromosome partitioning protein
VLSTVVDAADFVILPTEPSPLSIAPLVRTIQEFVMPRGKGYRVLLNKVDPRVPQDVQDAEALLDGYEIDRFRHHVRNYKVHSTAPIEGHVVTQYAPGRTSAKAIDDYRRVAMEMFATWANAAK